MSNRNKNDYSPILHEKSAEYFWKGTGALSIKTFSGGRAMYQAGHGHFAVEEGRYLLLNQGQEYSISIEADRPVESFCVFFPEGFVPEVGRSLTMPVNTLLDEPFRTDNGQIDFVMRTYEILPELSCVLQQMRLDSMQQLHDEARMEEQLYALASVLIGEHLQVRREIAELSSIKASTRQELYRRLYTGYEYILAYYKQPISVSEVAETACLSTNHFLRSFKQLFGATPYQIIKEKRLREAERLLRHTDLPVTEICFEVGFQSTGSFSTSFFRRFGDSPSAYRHEE